MNEDIPKKNVNETRKILRVGFKQAGVSATAGVSSSIAHFFRLSLSHLSRAAAGFPLLDFVLSSPWICIQHGKDLLRS